VGSFGAYPIYLGIKGAFALFVLTWLNEGLEPSVRATVISMGSQSGALGEALAGLVVGAIGNLAGVRAALTAGALALALALMLYARAIQPRAVEPVIEGANYAEKSNRSY
jgi:succinate-acetate transporter protein